MAQFELVMPKLGESIMEATIITWLKQPGDEVEAEEPILEIATDKVDSEVPSPVDGVLKEIKFSDNDVVPVDTVIAVIETEGDGGASAPPAPASEPEPEKPAQQPAFGAQQPAPQTAAAQSAAAGADARLTEALLDKPQSGRFYSPLVMNIAREENIPMDELDRLPGTGREGRVTKKDILAYVEARQKGGAPVSAPAATPQTATNGQTNGRQQTPAASAPEPQAKTFSFNGPVEIVEMDRMRKMISENMVYSKRTSPHVTSFVEADVTNLFLWRKKIKNEFEQKYGQKISFTHVFIEVVAKVLREFPWLNASVEGDKILLKKDVNIGLAVALPSGNLIVPVLKKADQFNLPGIAAQANDLTERARNNKLKPDDLSDGTYTLSNVGTFGNLMGTPIILQPQVGVLATGVITKKPAVVETEAGDMIAVRQKMFLSHSYDHRIIDGAMGGQFVRRVGDLLENWDMNREV